MTATGLRRSARCIVTRAMALMLASVPASAAATPDDKGLFNAIATDHGNFYAAPRLGRMAGAFAGGALLANTNGDREFQDLYQRALRTEGTDDVTDVVKRFGRNRFIIPATLAAGAVQWFDGDSVIGTWGERASRALLVGGPAMYAAQNLTGASRPGERRDASRWRPLNDLNGVSGHAFFGAVPFLIAASMAEDRPWLRYGAYAASAAAAWARVNDNDHFLSQSVLGWYLAWEAVDAVEATAEPQSDDWRVMPMADGDAVGVLVQGRW